LQFIIKRRSGLVARHGKDVIPIWQTDRRPKHAAGSRAINQEAFDLPCPGGGGRAELKQALTYDNKLISHFYNFGDRGFLTHKVRPDDLGSAQFPGPLSGKSIKTSLY
jgi:hypothetical protein